VIQDDAGANASIIKTGPGKMELTGNNTYTGTTTIDEGIVLVQGLNPTNQGTYIVNGGELGGSGTINRLQIGLAVVSPGNAGPGLLKVHDIVVFSGFATYVVNINGQPQAQFDQLRMARLSLEAQPAILDPRLGFTPDLGAKFRIIDITGPDPVRADRFFQTVDGNVLTEGETFQINGLNFTISYAAGTGNDINLTRNTGAAFANRAITAEITEGQTAFITGHITEPNHQDTFFLDVDWGDGKQQTFTFPPGSPKDIKVGHRYLDDPAGTDDRYQVKLSWRDQHGGGNSAVLETIVRNSAPVLGEITSSLPPFLVGEPITIRGSITDVPKDSFRVHVRWDLNGPWQAINLPAGTKFFQLKHTYATAGDHHVTMLLVDDDLDLDDLSFLLHVGG
jgi:autotransporter-associated beta strand protein